VWFNFRASVTFPQECCCSLNKIFLCGLPIATSKAYIIFFRSNPSSLKFPHPLSTGLYYCCPGHGRPALRLRRARTTVQRPGTIQPLFFPFVKRFLIWIRCLPIWNWSVQIVIEVTGLLDYLKLMHFFSSLISLSWKCAGDFIFLFLFVAIVQFVWTSCEGKTLLFRKLMDKLREFVLISLYKHNFDFIFLGENFVEKLIQRYL